MAQGAQPKVVFNNIGRPPVSSFLAVAGGQILFLENHA
jgi:hypothetical protein